MTTPSETRIFIDNTIQRWRRRSTINGTLTKQQMDIYRLLKKYGPHTTLNIILRLSKGPMVARGKNKSIEDDLKLMEHAGFVNYDVFMHTWFVLSKWGRVPKGYEE